jgi:hypothetical protein
MARTITITAMERPHLLRKMLATLLSNDLDGWKIHVAVEPNPRAGEVVALCRDLLGETADVRVNERVLGIRANPYQVQSRAFAAGSDLNLYLEEDLLLAPDATRMARWFEENHRLNWMCLNLLAATCGSAGPLSDPSCPGVLFEAGTFNSLGFAVRRQEWQRHIAPVWARQRSRPWLKKGPAHWRTHWGWDWDVLAYMVRGSGMVSVQPVLARATHNGPAGTFCTADFHDLAFDGVQLADGEHTFSIAAGEELPRNARSIINLQQEQLLLRMQLESALTGRFRRETLRIVDQVRDRVLRRP